MVRLENLCKLMDSFMEFLLYQPETINQKGNFDPSLRVDHQPVLVDNFPYITVKG